MIEPHIHDVLCGRGKGSYKHVGNVVYRELVNLYKNEYISCKKHEKKKISERIVHAIQTQNPPGRFLEFHTKTSSWLLVSDNRSIEKTSQTFRENHGSLLAPNNIPDESQVNEKQVKEKPFNPNFNFLHNINNGNLNPSPPQCMLPNNNNETMSQVSKSSFSNLSSYNKLILANLQKDYNTSSSLSSSSGSVSSHQCNNQDEFTAMNNSQTSFMSNNNDSVCMKEDDVDIDDDILMTIMDLDHDWNFRR